MNIIKSLIYFIFSVQEKVLKARLNKTLNIKNSSKRKKIYSNGCVLSLDALADDEKNKMEDEISLVLKLADYSEDGVIKYIENAGTRVFRIKSPEKLHLIGEAAGFIYPECGLKAVYLSLLLSGKIRLKTDELFVLPEKPVNKYYFIYHFYNWYAYKHGISGMDTNSAELLNKFLFSASDDDINKMQLSDIYKLKDAIKQDKSAIEFVFKLCRNYEGAQKALNKLKNDGANI